MIRKILNAWSEFLSSGDSLYALNDSPTGWKCAQARQAVGIKQYEHDPKDEHWGFASWNDFFTRRFKDGERPVASPDDDKVIVSACESTPYGISTRSTSSSAGPSIRPSSARPTTTAGTARWPGRSCGRSSWRVLTTLSPTRRARTRSSP